MKIDFSQVEELIERTAVDQDEKNQARRYVEEWNKVQAELAAKQAEFEQQIKPLHAKGDLLSRKFRNITEEKLEDVGKAAGGGELVKQMVEFIRTRGSASSAELGEHFKVKNVKRVLEPVLGRLIRIVEGSPLNRHMRFELIPTPADDAPSRGNAQALTQSESQPPLAAQAAAQMVLPAQVLPQAQSTAQAELLSSQGVGGQTPVQAPAQPQAQGQGQPTG